MRTLTLPLAAISAALLIAGCASGSSDPAPAAADQPASVEFVAYDMGYEPIEATVPAGTVEITLVNDGAAVHNVIIEELDDLNVAEAGPGETNAGTVDLAPGTYTIYCDIPGHRSAGMDRVLFVE